MKDSNQTTNAVEACGEKKMESMMYKALATLQRQRQLLEDELANKLANKDYSETTLPKDVEDDDPWELSTASSSSSTEILTDDWESQSIITAYKQRHRRQVALVWLVACPLILGIPVALSFAIKRSLNSDYRNPTTTTEVHGTTGIRDFSCFWNRDELVAAVDDYVEADDPSQSGSALLYGYPMATWCVDHVTDFSTVFSAYRQPRMEEFNEDLSAWKTSSAINMIAMFDGCANFNGDIDSWDVSNVKRADSMFRHARRFNRDISSWNLASVQDLDEFVLGASDFAQDLCPWQTRLPQGWTGIDMFKGTVCPNVADPVCFNLQNAGTKHDNDNHAMKDGSFCFVCT
jgi:surface protein